MNKNEAKSIVARKHKLGTTLVTGHAAKYWEEAMDLYKGDIATIIEEYQFYLQHAKEDVPLSPKEWLEKKTS